MNATVRWTNRMQFAGAGAAGTPMMMDARP
jgi:hypothetical protein